MSALTNAATFQLHDLEDGDVRDDPHWQALLGDDPVKAFLAEMWRKHLPGLHDQRDHGRRHRGHAVPSVPDVPDVPVHATEPKPPSPAMPPSPRRAPKPKPAAPAHEHVPQASVSHQPGRVRGRDITAEVDYKSLPSILNLKTGENEALKAVLRHQGFDGKPQVVTAAEFDAAVKRRDVRQTWRGIRKPMAGHDPEVLAETYRTGELRAGTGINGDGTYVAANRADAEYYGTAILRIGLRKDAKVISADDLDREMDAFFAQFDSKGEELQEMDENLLKDLARAKSPRARANLRRTYRGLVYGLDPDRRLAVQRDPGTFAALRGYDAIEIPKVRSPDKHHELIILNRTATIVQEAQP